MRTKPEEHRPFAKLVPKVFFIVSVFVGVPCADGQGLDLNVLDEFGYNRVGSEFWGSGGAGISEHGIRAAAFANPALISFTSATVTVEGGWRPKTDYFNRMELDNTVPLPTYASIGLPLGTMSIEAGYCRAYDSRTYEQSMTMTSPPQPDGFMFGPLEYRASVHTAFASASYAPVQNLVVGLTAGLDFITYSDDAFTFKRHGDGTRMQFTLGAVAQPFETASFGVTLHGATRSSLANTIDYSEPGYRIPVSYWAKSPMDIALGGSYDATPWLTLLGSADYVNWSALEEGQRDVWQYHLGAAASVLPEATIRAGFFTQRSSSDVLSDYYDESFLTAGASWGATENVAISITYITSALFTKDKPGNPFPYAAETLQQSMLSGGVSYAW